MEIVIQIKNYFLFKREKKYEVDWHSSGRSWGRGNDMIKMCEKVKLNLKPNLWFVSSTGLNLGLYFACCHSLSKFIWTSVLLYMEKAVFLESFTTSWSYNISAPLVYRSPRLKGRSLIKTLHLGPSYLMHIAELWVSIVALLSTVRSFSDEG